MTWQEKIYRISPVIIQNIICNLEGEKIYRRRFSKNFFELFNSIKERDKISQDEMEELQLRRLKRQCIIAYENSLYYKDLFDRYGFNPYKMKCVEEIGVFPVLTKEEMQKDISKFINRHIRKRESVKIGTSGTTGAGLVFPVTKECENEQRAAWWRYRHNLGINFDTWCANFGGKVVVPLKQNKPPYHRTIYRFRQISFSMYHLSEDTVKEYFNVINDNKIEWIHAFPSTLSYFCSLMKKAGLSFEHEIKYITIGAESLLPHQEKIIYNVLGSRPLQHYGLSEPVANISQCEHGRLHVDEDFSYVEFIPVEGNPDCFHIVGSSFANDALFFLRYNTNDIVTLEKSEKRCPCGRNGRIVKDLEGRKYDYIVQKDGSKIMILGHIFRNMINIREVQIKQVKSEFVTFYVVRCDKYSYEDEKILKEEIEMRFKIDYAIEYVDEISKTKRGKHRLVISELANDD